MPVTCMFLRKSILTATLCVIATALAACPGCASRRSKTIDVLAARSAQRDTARAIELNRQALAAQDDLEQAESLLQAATEADVTFGPAHNNLGIVYFKNSKYYQAAWQFQYAAKLMPKNTQPLVNLGLVFEAVGQRDEAMAEYDKALELTSDDLAAVQCMARLLARTGQDPQREAQLVKQVALHSEDPTWQSWARFKLAKTEKNSD